MTGELLAELTPDQVRLMLRFVGFATELYRREHGLGSPSVRLSYRAKGRRLTIDVPATGQRWTVGPRGGVS